jgi:hypothetical protein
MSEKALEQYLVKRAKANGWLTYKWVSPAQRGVPDRILIAANGRVVFVELKNPDGTGRLSPLQQHTITQLGNHGCDVRVAQSKEEVDALFA